MKEGVDKVKWLKEHGPLPQFNRNVRIKIDRKTGDVVMDVEDAMKMKAKHDKAK